MVKTFQGSQGKEESNQKEKPITGTLQDRRERNQILKLLSKRTCHPRKIYPGKLFCRYEGEINSFPDMQKRRDFIIRRPPWQKTLKVTENLKQTTKSHKTRSKITNKFKA